MNQTLLLGIVVVCAAALGTLAILLATLGDIEAQTRTTRASARPGRPASQKPAPAPSQGELALQGLNGLLGGVADPWLGLLTQLGVFTLFVVSLKRGFHRSVAGRPARWHEGDDLGHTLPAGYRDHFSRAAGSRNLSGATEELHFIRRLAATSGFHLSDASVECPCVVHLRPSFFRGVFPDSLRLIL
jgi:hypothetical protein